LAVSNSKAGLQLLLAMTASWEHFLNKLTIVNLYSTVNFNGLTFVPGQSRCIEFESSHYRNIDASEQSVATLSPSTDCMLESQHPRRWRRYFWQDMCQTWKNKLLLSFTKACVLMILLSLIITVVSLVLAVWWSVTRNDIQGGCALGGYVVSVSAVVVGMAGLLHRRKCKCWVS
jgi:hypothetical protein